MIVTFGLPGFFAHYNDKSSLIDTVVTHNFDKTRPIGKVKALRETCAGWYIDVELTEESAQALKEDINALNDVTFAYRVGG